ncbi:MAG: hypothetical protein ACO1NM_07025 [Sphingobium phenoxybenzoativorans]
MKAQGISMLAALSLGAASLAAPSLAASSHTQPRLPPMDKGTGYICTSVAGEVRRLNIDVAGMRYQREGEAPYSLARVSETSLVLTEKTEVDLQDPTTGPVSMGEELDRRTLILSSEVSVPAHNMYRKTDYKCVSGPMINLALGR